MKRPVLMMICISVLVAMPLHGGSVSFSREETDYLAKTKVFKAASIDGGAPHHYKDSKGEIKGIAINVLKEIEAITGITVEFHLYATVSQALSSDSDIFFGLTKEYNSSNLALSEPYLYSETVLFYHKSLNPTQLAEKRYAGIKGGTLPKGVPDKHAIYFFDREATINAVEKGKADYGYGNAYSLAYYSLQNSYNNIIMVPTGKEDRAYCLGVAPENRILLSILNKAIEAIDKSRMDTLVLDVAAQVERKITITMILGSYGAEILTIAFLIMLVLAYLMLSNNRAKNQYKMENQRYQIISNLSDEYLFEYHIKTDGLKVAERLGEKLGPFNNKAEALNIIKNSVKEAGNNGHEGNSYTIKLPYSGEDFFTFRVLVSYLKDANGKKHSVIGKLVDISREEKEKEKLIAKSQLDGLTGLYNGTTAREKIIKSMAAKDRNSLDALIILDCDNFKKINDSLGHLAGDLVLQHISKSLQLTFRQIDIIGRLGGDEFCVYMPAIPFKEFVQTKYGQLMGNMQKLNEAFPVELSVGIAVYDKPAGYETLFKQADTALYSAKNAGGGKAVFYNENLLII
ncbi:hypothetical protein MASR2M29_20100 [Spirochaetota bacterium]